MLDPSHPADEPSMSELSNPRHVHSRWSEANYRLHAELEALLAASRELLETSDATLSRIDRILLANRVLRLDARVAELHRRQSRFEPRAATPESVGLTHS